MSLTADGQLVRDAISVSGLLISLFLLFIHIKNRKTQLQSFWLARHAYRSSSIELLYVSSEQLTNSVILKLVLMNPGSIAAIIQCFSIHKEITSGNPLIRWLGIKQWIEVDGYRWWPTQNAQDKTIKHMADEYKNLFVADQRDILVSFPGFIERNRYRFEIKTNAGTHRRTSNIDASRTYFAHAFSRQWLRD